MSDNILIDGKPLNTLRVVDLKEELRKRGIRSSGTKSQLQQLLLTALHSTNQPDQESAITDEAEPIKNAIEPPEKIDDSIVNDNSNSKSIDSTEKFASISINEEKETIKLTIRSSPRKQEPVQQQDSESEASQSDVTDSDSEQQNKNDIVNTSQNEIAPPLIEPENKTESKADNTEEKSSEQVTQEIKPQNSHDEQEAKLEQPKIDECKIESQPITKIEESSKNEIEIKSDDSKSRTSILKNRMATQKSIEGPSGKPVQKKRRWGSSQTNESSVLKKGISSDELKQLINDSMMDNDQPVIKVSKSSEDKTFFSNKTDEPPQQQKSVEVTEMEIKKVDISFKNNVVEMSQVATPQKENGNIEENDQRSVCPAKNPESTVLFITGLVRPYTLMQLKKLLNSVGQIDEEKFWIDKIKSKCYATYSSVDEAVKTRENLHNLKWPQSSPKNLCVEFATLEDIDRCLHPENYEDLPMKNVDKNSSSIAQNKGKYDIIMKEPKVETFGKTNDKSESIAARGNIREWDRDKVAVKVSRHEEKEKNDDDNQRQLKKHKDESPSEHHHHHHYRDKPAKTTEKKEELSNQRNQEPRSESPMNSLEDLFRKTKTIPYIYWLPLTDEQALEREKHRNQLEKEREARISQRMEMPTRRSSPPPPPPMFRDMHRGRRTSPTNFRRKPSYSPVYRRNLSRYSRSRSPDRRRFSPRRR
ncbi:uncharacterized protein LOC124492022 isoform X2 [Dermatophagoides farinae]|uniref:uncharacterized protein LOC124492022 isoform X2 n=1 Tax=Dermatophagoides farinae TaxID=6954 RepID=UPI003F63588B